MRREPVKMFLCAARELLRRYFVHDIGRDSAALTYYLIFALFPLLVFISSLFGFLDFDAQAVLDGLSRFMPQEVTELFARYLSHTAQMSSRALLGASLVFSIYFPMRATECLLRSVRKAYGLDTPRRLLVHLFKTALFTLFLIIFLPLSLLTITVSGRLLSFVGRFIPPVAELAQLWGAFRFILLGALLFLALSLLHALGRDGRRGFEMARLFPGVAFSLAGGLLASAVFSWYAANAGRYSLLFGSIGTIVVLLLWIRLFAIVTILGAEFNSVLMTLRGRDSDFSKKD
ncbi:MAG: YihY/virulence factor BrkB family protein [Oscillospiraceae bacterium]|nr:YihY/virulence factor BrkB family protein [Oscillospiraceae bacterium]